MNNINQRSVTIKAYAKIVSATLDLSHSKDRKFKSAINQYIKVMEHRIATRGLRETVTFLKLAHNLSTKLSLGYKFDALPWTKSDKSGFPVSIDKVKPFLVGQAQDKRVGLCITMLYKVITLPVDTNTKTITGPSTSTGKLGTR